MESALCQARSWSSTAPRCPSSCWRANCSATSAAPLPAPIKDKPGRLEAADGGTVFLDEIADLSAALASQVAALRAGAELRAGRRERHHPRRRPHNRRLQSRPASGSRRAPLSRGPVLPAQRDHSARAAVARAPRGHPAAGRTDAFRRQRCATGAPGCSSRRKRPQALEPLSMAGKRARTAQRARTRRRAQPQRDRSRRTTCPTAIFAKPRTRSAPGAAGVEPRRRGRARSHPARARRARRSRRPRPRWASASQRCGASANATGPNSAPVRHHTAAPGGMPASETPA